MAATLRVLAFAGSTRKVSFNRKLVRVAAIGARDAGAVVSEIDLADFRLPLFDQDEEAEHGKPERATALKRLFVGHDALLIASPEYNGSLTGVLKNTIDWVSRPDDGETTPLVAFRGKAVAVMSASPGALGGLRGLVHLRAILGGLGCIMLPDQVVVPKAIEAFDSGGGLNDQQQAQALALGRSLAEVGHKLIG